MGRQVPYFTGNWARACGWAMSDGALFSQTPQNAQWPSFVVDAAGMVSIGQFDQIGAGARQVVSGNLQIVVNGRNAMSLPGAPQDSSLAPRTAVGIDALGKLLILLVVDGRRPQYSAGMNYRELADEMIRLGAWQAINLDGAGSSTMVMRDSAGHAQVMNRPSDGHDFVVDLSVERNVADALGVIVDDTQPNPRP